MKDFVEGQVRSEGYSTASEYIRQLIRQAQSKNATLEEMLLAGMKSGNPHEMTPDDWSSIRNKVHRLARPK